MKRIISLIFALIFLPIVVIGQFISEVLEYTPAPGQWINTYPSGSPASVQSLIGGTNGHVSLGAFGGYLVFRFEEPVENDTDNPYGIDFTIFGNPLTDWSEPAVVYVMKDENANGEADDTWYELAGSEYFFSSTLKNYEVTYTNPGNTTDDIPWSDNYGNSGVVLNNAYHTQAFYPLNDSFPNIPNDEYTLSGTRLMIDIDRSGPQVKSYLKSFGYADNQMRGDISNPLPDNPYTSAVENSGGDAFDISWAINSEAQYVDLDEIHFIKVQSAALEDGGWLGEISTEITGARDVAPDASINGSMDLIELNLPDTVWGSSVQLEAFAFENGRWNKDREIDWSLSLEKVHLDEKLLLTFSESGTLKLKASFADNSSVKKSDSIVLIYEDGTGINPESIGNQLKLYPNPASDILYIQGLSAIFEQQSASRTSGNKTLSEPLTTEPHLRDYEEVLIKIVDISGKTVVETQQGSIRDGIFVNHLKSGIYFLKIVGESPYCLKFVKR